MFFCCCLRPVPTKKYRFYSISNKTFVFTIMDVFNQLSMVDRYWFVYAFNTIYTLRNDKHEPINKPVAKQNIMIFPATD